MADWTATASIIGSAAALVGIIATAVSVFRHAMSEAEERGRMRQRQDEVEDDLKGAFEKIRAVAAETEERDRALEIRQNKQEADAVEIRATLHSVEKKVDYTNSKLDELIRFHNNGGRH
jgi:uncharacterized membrane protein YhiD involved in acid resistance